MPVYVCLGWLLIAIVSAFANVSGLGIFLPATSVVVLVHALFSDPGHSVVRGMILAIILGYLEDLHQAGFVGLSSLVYVLAYLALVWSATRLSVRGVVTRALVCASAVGLVDALSLAALWILAPTVGINRDALLASIPAIGWQVLATLLLAQPIWVLLDFVFYTTRLQRVAIRRGERRPAPEHKR